MSLSHTRSDVQASTMPHNPLPLFLSLACLWSLTSTRHDPSQAPRSRHLQPAPPHPEPSLQLPNQHRDLLVLLASSADSGSSLPGVCGEGHPPHFLPSMSNNQKHTERHVGSVPGFAVSGFSYFLRFVSDNFQATVEEETRPTRLSTPW